MSDDNDYSVRIIGAGAVAPSGVGSQFFDNLAHADRASGIRSLNRHLAGVGALDRILLTGIQPLYTGFLLDGTNWGTLVDAALENKDGPHRWILDEAQQQIGYLLSGAGNHSRPGDEWQVAVAGVQRISRDLLDADPTASADRVHFYGQVREGLSREELLAVLACRFRQFREEFIFGHHGGYPAPIRPSEDIFGNTTHWDIFGIVPSAALLPWLLPLEGMIFQDGIGTMDRFDRHVLDALFLSLPRATGMALVSTFQGLLDAAGLLEGVERQLMLGASGFMQFCADFLQRQDRDGARFDEETGQIEVEEYSELAKDLIPPFLEFAIPLFRDTLEMAKHHLQGEEGRPIGLIVGSAGGNVEVMAGYAVRLDRLGLNREIRFSKQVFKASPWLPFPETDPNRPPLDKLSAVQLNNEMRQVNHNYTAGLICRIFELEGDQLTISTSCCSGQTALITAARNLDSDASRRRKRGERPTEIYVVTGVDCALWPEYFSGFYWTGVMANLPGEASPVDGKRTVQPGQQTYSEACTPYKPWLGKGDHDCSKGWVFGEGAGTVVLATDTVEQLIPPVTGRRRGVSVTAWDMGNAFTENSWDPRKREVLSCTLGKAPDGCGLVLGYGLGDRDHLMDLCEVLNLFEVVAAGAGRMQVTLASLKEGLGHSMGGSSALAAAVAYRALSGRALGLSSRHSQWIDRLKQALWALPSIDELDGEYQQLRQKLCTDFHQTLAGVQFVPEGGLDRAALAKLPWVLLNGSGLGGTVDAVLLEPVPADCPGAAQGRGGQR